MELVTVNDAGGNRSSYRFRDRKTDRVYQPNEFLQRCPVLVSNADITPGSAETIRTTLFLVVRIQFTELGTLKLQRTLDQPGSMLATTLDGELISLNAVPPRERVLIAKPRKQDREKRQPNAPPERSSEKDAAAQLELTGGFTSEEEAAALAAVINAGPLPFPLKVTSSRLVSQ